MYLERPTLACLKDIDDFFEMMIKDTFRQNGIKDLLELIDEEINVKKSNIRKDLASEGADHHFLIGFEAGQVIGTIELAKASSLVADCSKGELKDWYEIGSVFVHPDFQKKGLSLKLFEGIVETMKLKGIHQYCFDSGYPVAQKIWTKRFGKPAYYLKDFWAKGSDHMIWIVRL